MELHKLINDRYTVTAYCERHVGDACHHWSILDLHDLVGRFGLDYDLMAQTFNHLLRCTKCGSRKASIRVTPDTTPPDWPHGRKR